jgi:hypothetical protein
MRKPNDSQTGFFNPRIFAAFLLCSAGGWLAMFSLASASPNAPLTFGGPDPTVPGNPRYQNFYAPAGSSAEPGSGEFNIGFDPMTHRILTMNTGPIWRLTPPEILIPAKPECCEALWEDKSANTTSVGLDPILWTDQKTGRTFVSNSTAGANAVYAYTDAAAPFNDGDLWIEVGAAPANGSADHETLGSGPYPASLSALTTPVNHGEMVFYCAQAGVGPASCQRSDDLGSSYGPGVLTYNGFTTACGGLHGHLHVAPDGTAWLPANQCGGKQGGAISIDGGVTWSEFIVQKTGSGGFTATSQADGADPSIGIDSNNTVYYCYVNDEGGGQGHVHVAVGKRSGSSSNVNWLRDTDVGASHGIVNAVETEAVGGSTGRAACGFIGTNAPDGAGGGGGYENGNFNGVWYAYIATTYDEGATWVTVNATPNDPVQNHTGVWQQGGSGENGDRNLLDFNEITIDDKGRVLYGYSDGCHTLSCIQGDNLGNRPRPNPDVDPGPYLERGAFMRVARQTGGKTLLASYDVNTDTTVATAPKPACFSATRDCSAAHLSWKAPDNGGADITGYSILRGTSAGGETVLVANTGNTNITFDDPVDPSVRHYFYVVKAINAQGAGFASNEVDLSSDLLASDDTATTNENQAAVINVLANDCGLPALTVSAVGTPGHGTAIINGDSTITYTPANNYFGFDSFTYTARNGSGATATRNVRVLVNPCALVDTGAFLDDFESGAPGWTVVTTRNKTAASATWTVVPDPRAHSAARSFYSDSTTLDLKDDFLYAPAQNLSSTSHLKFWHRYQFEDGFDGGAVEVSTDGGKTWVDVVAGGGRFVTGGGGYNAHISPSYGSGIAGRPGWSGGDASGAMTQVDIDMGAYAGFDVRVRFHLACDELLAGSQPGVGWFIDDVQFTNTPVNGVCPTVVSRKTHGLAGDFDIALPATGTIGEEMRTPPYKLIYTLDRNVTVAASANVTVTPSGSGAISAGPNSNQVTVDLSNVPNAQHVVVTLNGIKDAGSSAILSNLIGRIDVLLGDVNINKVLTNADVSLVKAQVASGGSVTSSNFRNDVNANGVITNADVSVTKAQVAAGAQLP